jgi:hypothetical protein
MTAAAVTRMAGQALKGLLPSTWGGALLEFGPDVAFSALAGSQAPDGWQVPIAAEDLAINLGGSLLGRVLGRGVGSRVLKNATPEQLANAANIGSMAVAAPASIFGPRPVFNAMLEEQQGSPAQEQAARADEAARIAQSQLVNSVAMAAPAVATGLAGRPVSLLDLIAQGQV